MADIHQRVSLIRAGAQVGGQTNFAEALAQVFEDRLITDGTGDSSALASRLMNILTTSADGFAPNMSHFSGIFADWTDGAGGSRRGDTGFKSSFQDFPPWPGSSMQVGHFMTAVDMGFQPAKLYDFLQHKKSLPVLVLGPLTAAAWYWKAKMASGDADTPVRQNWWTYGERECVQLMIAHEQIEDSGVYGQEPSFWNKISTVLNNVSDTDEDSFRTAFTGLGDGLLHDADKAAATLRGVSVGTGSGNSRQDLLLSLFGFKFGSMIRKGVLSKITDGAAWIRLNLVDPSFPLGPGKADV